MSQQMTMKQTAINWFEIPCEDLDRAAQFYETLLNVKLLRTELDQNPMVIFSSEQTGANGNLVKRPFRKPGRGGTMVYLNCDGELDDVLARVPKAGGLVLQPKTPVPGGHGHFACLRDSEGNHVGLHSH
jgi:uncharacterized protein